MAWCLPDEASEYADKVLAALESLSAIVPPLWRFEVGNTLLVNERRLRVSPLETADFIGRLRLLPISADSAQTGMERLVSIGREAGASAYDAAYLELAQRRNLPLATLDRRLQAGAARVRIELFEPI